MRSVRSVLPMLLLGCLVAPDAALAQDLLADSRAQFEVIVQDLNQGSFEKFRRAINKRNMLTRVYAKHAIDPEVKRIMEADFDQWVEQMFVASLPVSQKDVAATVVGFEATAGKGRAVVRYAATGYRYSYHDVELTLDSKGRPTIVDWIDYYGAARFSEEAAETFVRMLPSTAAIRRLIEYKNADSSQVFRVTELLKAARDNQPERYFEIYDDLDEEMRHERVVVRSNLMIAVNSNDGDRVKTAFDTLIAKYPSEPIYSLRRAGYYLLTQQFEKAIDEFLILQKVLGVKDGATGSLMTSAALAVGDVEDAEKYALEATVAEPGLELSWWSLLRARSAANNFQAATDALVRLEDDFGHKLDAAKLRRDRYHGFLTLVESQEYKDWRETRE